MISGRCSLAELINWQKERAENGEPKRASRVRRHDDVFGSLSSARLFQLALYRQFRSSAGHAYFTHFATSLNDGFFPYISIPTR